LPQYAGEIHKTFGLNGDSAEGHLARNGLNASWRGKQLDKADGFAGSSPWLHSQLFTQGKNYRTPIGQTYGLGVQATI